MAFTVVELTPTIFHLQSGANSGLIRTGSGAILIDAGLDDDAGKKIKKTLESLGLTLHTLIITHAHADHFGGAAYLRKTLPPFTVYAPAIESALIQNPILEGIFLSAGALPFDALTGKFTRAGACQVDQELQDGFLQIGEVRLIAHPIPGHSPNQKAIQVEEVWFTADAFFPAETLRKYPVPFLVHIGQTLTTLEQLLAVAGTSAICAPGHGVQLTGSALVEVIQTNQSAIHAVLDQIERLIADSPNGLDEGTLTQSICKALGDPLATPVSYYLARSTIQAGLVYHYEQGRIKWANVSGRLVWVKS
jgi:glyoxylase-like metal-dependent hydrolase (beta-lactamase superfamily II)